MSPVIKSGLFENGVRVHTNCPTRRSRFSLRGCSGAQEANLQFGYLGTGTRILRFLYALQRLDQSAVKRPSGRRCRIRWSASARLRKRNGSQHAWFHHGDEVVEVCGPSCIPRYQHSISSPPDVSLRTLHGHHNGDHHPRFCVQRNLNCPRVGVIAGRRPDYGASDRRHIHPPRPLVFVGRMPLITN